MVDVYNVLDRYHKQLSGTGYSSDTLKVFVMSMICDWKDEILQCDPMWIVKLSHLCDFLDGSSCVFQYDNQCDAMCV